MQAEITVRTSAPYVEVRPTTDVKRESMCDFWRWAVRSALAFGRDLLLVDLQGRTSCSTLADKYYLAYFDSSDLDFHLLERVALVSDCAEDNGLDFLETVMRNAGYEWRVFALQESADQWLRQ